MYSVGPGFFSLSNIAHNKKIERDYGKADGPMLEARPCRRNHSFGLQIDSGLRFNSIDLNNFHF